ncbi:hypothetical protein SAMN04487948_1255 [Halogranum amylolyticum]|uniref:Uncharacterized protein n=1 Tax=Halogranum amylolyticum TaxID=660520 RepID=A0A1H8W7P9_9EURY|nr:hypothetical protein [Halogranum amylolyticum]SEP23684.1 hypothetical protein SAMN04487948_1255 [Halogranum amylolyticum]
MDSASPSADRTVGSDRLRTQPEQTLAGKLFATHWTTGRFDTEPTDGSLKRR